MGFYGNLTNTARTQFQFDRIYPNRYSMEANMEKDGVYLGRYVLVEYDADIHEDNIRIAYEFDKKFYGSSNVNTDDSRLVLNEFQLVTGTMNSTIFANGEYYIEENGFHHRAIKYEAGTTYYTLKSGNAEYGIEIGEIIQTRYITNDLTGRFWKCIGSDSNGVYAEFLEISDEVTTNFLLNYQIDIAHFGPRQPEGAYSRAWDSTVWQKVYAQGEVKYIMIAELNAAAPSFSLAFDPPTQTPLAPHVDASSNNNVYQVHLQPTWGFRIKEEEDPEKSDLKVFHINSVYDFKTEQIHDVAKEVNGAIYLNKKGFNIEKSHVDPSTNYVAIFPTGKSNVNYAKHVGYFKTEDTHYQSEKDYYRYNESIEQYIKITDVPVSAEIPSDEIVYEFGAHTPYDINELEVHLPAIGNAVSDFYDLMYGSDKNNNNTRYRDLSWKYFTDEGRDSAPLDSGGATYDRTTVAGTINYLHQLEGMILYKLDSVPTDEEVQELSPEYIYCILSNSTTGADRYFYLHKTYGFDTDVVPYTYVLVNKNNENYISNCYYTRDGNTYVPDLGNSSYGSQDYYKRMLAGATYDPIGELTDYQANKYYYKVGSDYLKEKSNKFTESRNYFECDNSFLYKAVANMDNVIYGVDFYIDLSGITNNTIRNKYKDAKDGKVQVGWQVTTDETYSPEKTYYEVTDDWRLKLITIGAGQDLTIPTDKKIAEKMNVWPQDLSQLLIGELLELEGGQFYVDDIVIFRLSYEKDHLWYFESAGTGQISGQESFEIFDYLKDTNPQYTPGRKYYLFEPVSASNVVFYRPGQFVYFEADDGVSTLEQLYPNLDLGQILKTYARADNYNYPTAGRYYWSYKIDYNSPSWTIDVNTGQLVLVYPLEGVVRQPIVSITGQFRDLDGHLSPAEPVFNYYFKTQNEEVYHQLYSPVQSDAFNENNQFYSLESLNRDDYYQNNDFYIANKYYYVTDDGIFLCSDIYYDYSRKLYAIDINPNTHVLEVMTPVKFYDPATYYYRVNEDYFLDSNEFTTAGRIYYKKDVFRVYEDLLGYIDKGAAWSENIPLVPCTITLGKTLDKYELQEIGNVSTETNSINGLILKYNQMLSENDKVTRETTTTQGVLNLYSDIINRVDTNVATNKLVTTDMYGRFTTTDYSIQDLIQRIEQLESRI